MKTGILPSASRREGPLSLSLNSRQRKKIMTNPECSKENKNDGYELFPNDEDGSELEDYILNDHDRDDNENT